MRVLVLGGDGYLGWPTSMHFANEGHSVYSIDNLSKRKIESEFGVQPLNQISPFHERAKSWNLNQKNKINVYEDDLSDIFNSRTFCLFEDIENIKKSGLAKGGSLDNAIVVKNNEILNNRGLRNSKEFVNHKILDCIGDLYTSGYRIIASVNCSQGGHYLTNQLLKKVFENKDNFSIIEIQERSLPHTLINRRLLKSIA